MLYYGSEEMARLRMDPGDPMLNRFHVGKQHYVFRFEDLPKTGMLIDSFQLFSDLGEDLCWGGRRSLAGMPRICNGDTLDVCYERTCS